MEALKRIWMVDSFGAAPHGQGVETRVFGMFRLGNATLVGMSNGLGKMGELADNVLSL